MKYFWPTDDKNTSPHAFWPILTQAQCMMFGGRGWKIETPPGFKTSYQHLLYARAMRRVGVWWPHVLN